MHTPRLLDVLPSPCCAARVSGLRNGRARRLLVRTMMDAVVSLLNVSCLVSATRSTWPSSVLITALSAVEVLTG